MIWIVAVTLLLALVPCVLFLRNLSDYRLLAHARPANVRPRISVLIPARDEEENIAACVRSVLRSRQVEIEVVVLDDGSTDTTAEIVERIAQSDARLHLHRSSNLPPGWRGKTFACDQLARIARHPIFVFMDADVRITRADALFRLTTHLQQGEVTLLSGIPHQRTVTFLEKLIVPLMHWVLLGFLPIRRMRRTTAPAFAAACGQLIAVRRDAYESVRGHCAIRASLHDGIALARAFREANLKTDLFDATDSFSCRMYRRNADVWAGFLKNSAEGLGSRRLLGPSTLLLLGGQVLPFVMFFALSGRALAGAAMTACATTFLPRFIAAARFRQSLLGMILHPLGVLLLVAIQWHGAVRSFLRRPAQWRGRSCALIPSS